MIGRETHPDLRRLISAVADIQKWLHTEDTTGATGRITSVGGILCVGN
jgi:hypothetical protein